MRPTNRDIERHYFERFRKAYTLPGGAVAYGDKPDVTLGGARKIGIEITRFYLQSGSLPDSEQRQRPLRAAIVSEAQELYRAKGGKEVELTIGFDASNPLSPLRRRQLTEELAALARCVDNSPVSGALERSQFHAMPEILSVYFNARVYPDARWRLIGICDVGLMSPASLESIVREKEARSAEYQQRDAYWLLVVVEAMDAAQEQEIRIDDLNIASDCSRELSSTNPDLSISSKQNHSIRTRLSARTPGPLLRPASEPGQEHVRINSRPYGVMMKWEITINLPGSFLPIRTHPS